QRGTRQKTPQLLESLLIDGLPRPATAGVKGFAADFAVPQIPALEVSLGTRPVAVCVQVDLEGTGQIGVDGQMKIHDGPPFTPATATNAATSDAPRPDSASSRR